MAVSSLSTKSEGDASHSESRDFQHGPDGSGEDVSQSQSKHVDLQDESVPQTADAKQPESAPTNVQDNFDEVGGDQEEYVNSGLASCSGQLAFLCDFLTACRILQRQVAADNVINPFVVLPQMLDVVSKVADISKELVINCNQVLDNILKNGGREGRRGRRKSYTPPHKKWLATPLGLRDNHNKIQLIAFIGPL